MKQIFRAKVPIATKRSVFNTCVLPVLTYGSQTWSINKAQVKRLRVAQRAMERIMLGVWLRDRIRNTEVRNRTGLKDVARSALALKWQWAGHVARLQDDRWTRAVTEWIPYDGHRSRGRHPTRWNHSLWRFAGRQYTRIAVDREEWKRSEDAFARLWDDMG